MNMLHVETEESFYAPARITIVDFDRNLIYGEFSSSERCILQNKIQIKLLIPVIKYWIFENAVWHRKN